MLKEILPFWFSRVERYIPGMAFLYGFYQDHESNEKQEVFASVAPASDDTIDLKVKFPEVSQNVIWCCWIFRFSYKSICLHGYLSSSCVKVYSVLQQHAISNAVRGLGASEKHHKLNNGSDLDVINRVSAYIFLC